MKKRFIKGLVIAVLALMLVGGTVYGYVALNITAEVDVQEPISITSWVGIGGGNFDRETNVWDIGEIYPNDTVSLAVTFANAASGPITLTLVASPQSLDGGNLNFSFEYTTIEVPAGGTASVSITASATQSLAPGSYSTTILIQR